MINKSKNLFTDIIRLLAQADRDWVSIGNLLDQGSKTKVWDDLFGSTRQAIAKISELSKVKPASLWRFLSSVRFYNQLEKLFTDLDIPCLPLHSSCSAENIELLGRLHRVMPVQEFLLLAIKVLDNQITRTALRDYWNDYKPGLQGKTARGRGKPVINPDIHAVRKSQVQSFVRGVPFWATDEQLPDLPRHETLTQVQLPGVVLDLVVVVQTSPDNMLPELHGVQILEHSPNDAEYEVLEQCLEYCDALWIAVHIDSFREGDGSLSLPQGVGLLQIGDFAGVGSRITVISRADMSRKTSDLLSRCLVSHLLGLAKKPTGS